MTQPIPFQRGMNFGFAAGRGWYGSDEALAQIEKMKALNIDWVAAHVTFVQETYSSTRVFMDYEFTPDDREVLAWVRAARTAGLKVMLKPILEPLDGIWRGVVDPPKDGQSTFAKLNASFDYWWKWEEHQAEHRPQYVTDPAGDQGFVIDGKPTADTMKRLYGEKPQC